MNEVEWPDGNDSEDDNDALDVVEPVTIWLEAKIVGVGGTTTA
jgi:hypothetical protein